MRHQPLGVTMSILPAEAKPENASNRKPKRNGLQRTASTPRDFYISETVQRRIPRQTNREIPDKQNKDTRNEMSPLEVSCTNAYSQSKHRLYENLNHITLLTPDSH